MKNVATMAVKEWRRERKRKGEGKRTRCINGVKHSGDEYSSRPGIANA